MSLRTTWSSKLSETLRNSMAGVLEVEFAFIGLARCKVYTVLRINPQKEIFSFAVCSLGKISPCAGKYPAA